uniref:SHR-BD domain-containing protein n=1 Tax=Macrostomum lignano TaxID=282301 RepID=A0A1I8FJ19_9PLAT
APSPAEDANSADVNLRATYILRTTCSRRSPRVDLRLSPRSASLASSRSSFNLHVAGWTNPAAEEPLGGSLAEAKTCVHIRSVRGAFQVKLLGQPLVFVKIHIADFAAPRDAASRPQPWRRHQPELLRRLAEPHPGDKQRAGGDLVEAVREQIRLTVADQLGQKIREALKSRDERVSQPLARSRILRLRLHLRGCYRLRSSRNGGRRCRRASWASRAASRSCARRRPPVMRRVVAAAQLPGLRDAEVGQRLVQAVWIVADARLTGTGRAREPASAARRVRDGVEAGQQRRGGRAAQQEAPTVLGEVAPSSRGTRGSAVCAGTDSRSRRRAASSEEIGGGDAGAAQQPRPEAPHSRQHVDGVPCLRIAQNQRVGAHQPATAIQQRRSRGGRRIRRRLRSRRGVKRRVQPGVAEPLDLQTGQQIQLVESADAAAGSSSSPKQLLAQGSATRPRLEPENWATRCRTRRAMLEMDLSAGALTSRSKQAAQGRAAPGGKPQQSAEPFSLDQRSRAADIELQHAERCWRSWRPPGRRYGSAGCAASSRTSCTTRSCRRKVQQLVVGRRHRRRGRGRGLGAGSVEAAGQLGPGRNPAAAGLFAEAASRAAAAAASGTFALTFWAETGTHERAPGSASGQWAGWLVSDGQRTERRRVRSEIVAKVVRPGDARAAVGRGGPSSRKSRTRRPRGGLGSRTSCRRQPAESGGQQGLLRVQQAVQRLRAQLDMPSAQLRSRPRPRRAASPRAASPTSAGSRARPASGAYGRAADKRRAGSGTGSSSAFARGKKKRRSSCSRGHLAPAPQLKTGAHEDAPELGREAARLQGQAEAARSLCDQAPQRLQASVPGQVVHSAELSTSSGAGDARVGAGSRNAEVSNEVAQLRAGPRWPAPAQRGRALEQRQDGDRRAVPLAAVCRRPQWRRMYGAANGAEGFERTKVLEVMGGDSRTPEDEAGGSSRVAARSGARLLAAAASPRPAGAGFWPQGGRVRARARKCRPDRSVGGGRNGERNRQPGANRQEARLRRQINCGREGAG